MLSFFQQTQKKLMKTISMIRKKASFLKKKKTFGIGGMRNAVDILRRDIKHRSDNFQK